MTNKIKNVIEKQGPNSMALPDNGVANKQMVASYYGVTTRTIEKWCALGLLTKLNLPGKVIRFDVVDVRSLGSRSNLA